MRIGVVSDSHGNLYMLDKALKGMGSIDMIIHLGDGTKDIIALNEKYHKPLEYVCGNNDWSKEGSYEKTLNIGGKKIFITHGHKYDVGFGAESIYYKALEVDADVALYGHTHKQNLLNYANKIILNPGSIAFPRDIAPGAAVLIIDEKGIDINLIRLEY